MESIDFCNRQFLEHLGGGHQYHHSPTLSSSGYNHNYSYNNHQHHHLHHELLSPRVGLLERERNEERVETTRTQVEQVHSFGSSDNHNSTTTSHHLLSHFSPSSCSSPSAVNNHSLHQLTSFHSPHQNPFHSPNSILSSPISNISSTSPTFNSYNQPHRHSTPETRSDQTESERGYSDPSKSSGFNSSRSSNSRSKNYLYDSFLASISGSKYILPGLNYTFSKSDRDEERTSFPPSPSDSTGNETFSTEDENSSRSGFGDGSTCDLDTMKLLPNQDNHGVLRGHYDREHRRRRRHSQPPIIQRHAANLRERRRMQSINQAFEVRT